MEELLNQAQTEVDDYYFVSSLSDQLEQDYRRYAHYLDKEVIG